MFTEDKTLYIFIDESGNFDFSPTGTSYFVLTALSTYQPMLSVYPLHTLRYNLLSTGHDQEIFHATEDKQFVRDQVFETMQQLDSFEIDTVVAEKRKVPPDLYSKKNILYRNDGTIQYRCTKTEEIFYQKIAQTLLHNLFHRHNNFHKPFCIYFYDVKCDVNLQITDYCCWAIFIHFNRGEHRPFEYIQKNIKNISTIFNDNTRVYY